MRRRIAPDFETYVKAVERMKRQMAGHNPTAEELNILCQLAGGILENVPEEREYALKITRYIKECVRLFFANGDTSYASVYTNVLLVEARNRVVDSALIYLEKNRQPDRKFYMPRREMFIKHGIVQGLQDLLDDKIDFLSVSLPPGVGKLLADDTPVLTTQGFKKHGDLQVGDFVYGLDGYPKKVLHVFPKDKADCKITFTNGEVIKCHENHEWLVYNRHKQKEELIAAGELFNAKLETGIPNTRGHRYHYMLPNREAFTDFKIELPVQPYTFGVWLGNGKNQGQTICGAYDDLEIEKRAIEEEGYLEQWRTVHKDTGVLYIGFSRKLKDDLQKIGLCHSRRRVEKYIPDVYFTASKKQRLELLAGLIDTDGTRNGQKYIFSTTTESLRDGFIKLVSTFGWRCCVVKHEPKVSTSGIVGRNPVYSIGFSPDCAIPCRLARKQLETFAQKRRIAIKSIERCEPEQGNCIEVEGGYYCVGNTMLPTHNSTIEIFFLALVGGYWPNCFNLSSAHSSIMTRSIFDGIAEIIDDPVEYCWHEIFPDVHERSRSAKDTVINMGRAGRFKTWTMRSIDGSLTGATRANLFLTMDDMVSGIEEALNKTRMETLWVKVSNDLLSRRMDGCKTLCFATRWSVHDPIGKLQERNSDNPRARFIAVPALDEDGNSNFDYPGGFTTKYFMQQKDFMDDISFDALYQQKPIEREGLLFPSDQIRRFVRKDKDRYTKDGQLIDSMVDTVIMPDRKPDAIWAVCDTKDKGSDFESMPIAYQYDQDLFIVDVIFDDNTEYEVLDRKTADMLLKYNPHKTKFESNNAGSRVAYTIQSMIDEERRKGKVCRVDIEQQYTTANKETKILVNSSWILKHCYFLHHSQYMPKDDYGKFMSNVCEYTTKGKVPHDDAPDSLAMLAEYVQGFGYAEEAAIVASPLAWRR